MNWWIIVILMIGLILLTALLIWKKRKEAQEKKKIRDSKDIHKIALKEMLGIDRKIKNPKESLLILKKVAREFFKNYLKLDKQDTCVEIEELLEKKNQQEMLKFCRKMEILLYSGKEVTKSEALDMIEDFRNILKHKQRNN